MVILTTALHNTVLPIAWLAMLRIWVHVISLHVPRFGVMRICFPFWKWGNNNVYFLNYAIYDLHSYLWAFLRTSLCCTQTATEIHCEIVGQQHYCGGRGMLADVPLGQTELSRIEGVRLTKVTASAVKYFVVIRLWQFNIIVYFTISYY